MPRRNGNASPERRFDTRMSFKRMCSVLGIDPLQRIKLIKYMKTNLKMKEGEHIK